MMAESTLVRQEIVQLTVKENLLWQPWSETSTSNVRVFNNSDDDDDNDDGLDNSFINASSK